MIKSIPKIHQSIRHMRVRSASILNNIHVQPHRRISYFLPIRPHITEYIEFRHKKINKIISNISQMQSQKTKLISSIKGIQVIKSSQISEQLQIEVAEEQQQQQYKVVVQNYSDVNTQIGLRKIEAAYSWLKLTEKNQNLVKPIQLIIKENQNKKINQEKDYQLSFLENISHTISLEQIIQIAPQTLTQGHIVKLIHDIGTALHNLAETQVYIRDISPNLIKWNFKTHQWELCGIEASEYVDDNQIELVFSWGTPKYHAPETRVQTQSKITIDIHKSMAYAFGVILQDLLLLSNNQNINTELQNTVKNLLEENHTERYSIQQLLQSIPSVNQNLKIDQNLLDKLNKQNEQTEEEFSEDIQQLNIYDLHALNTFFEFNVINDYLEESLGLEQEQLANCLADFGEIQYQANELKNSKKLFQRAKEILEQENKIGLHLAKIYKKLAQIYQKSGETEKTQKYLKKSHGIFQEVFGEGFEPLLDLNQEEQNQESLQFNVSDNNDIQSLQKSIASLKKLGHSDSLILAQQLENLHNNLEQKGQYKNALEIINELTGITTKIYQGNNTKSAKYLTKQAITHVNYGEYDVARKLSTQATQLLKKHSQNILENSWLFDNLLCEVYTNLITTSTPTQNTLDIFQEILNHLETNISPHNLIVLQQVQNFFKLLISLPTQELIKQQEILNKINKFNVNDILDPNLKLLNNILFAAYQFTQNNQGKCNEILNSVNEQSILALGVPYNYQIYGLITHLYLELNNIAKAEDILNIYYNDVEQNLGSDNVFYVQALALQGKLQKLLNDDKKAEASYKKCKKILKKLVNKHHILFRYLDQLQ